MFFGHQSVGSNIVDALPEVFDTAGVEALEIVESRGPSGLRPGAPPHVHRQNGDPLGKIAEFDRFIRGGVGDAVDVASSSCATSTSTRATTSGEVFEAYRDTMAALERDYPT